MRLSRLFLLITVAVVAGGCSSGDAFVDRGYMIRNTKKEKLPGYNGSVLVCYSSDTPRERRDELAREACAVYGLEPRLVLDEKWQCRLTVPHLANYFCVDPKMVLANGQLINPFNASQVQAWRKQQARVKAGLPAEPARGERDEMPQDSETPTR